MRVMTIPYAIFLLAALYSSKSWSAKHADRSYADRRVTTNACVTAGEAVLTPSRFFDKEKSYSEEMYVFNDFLEFSVFDMSKLGLFINSKPVDLADSPAAAASSAMTTAGVGDNAEKGSAAHLEGNGGNGAEREIRALLGDIPRYFYTRLRQQLEKNRVPVTLQATNTPPYGKPLALYIKLKKINLLPATTDKKGGNAQPVSLKIYGQIKDKTSDKILLRFYNTAETEFAAGRAADALGAVADELMGDLAKFLATRY